MDSLISRAKETLRQKLLEQESGSRPEGSGEITEFLLNSEAYKEAAFIFAFAGMDGEPDTMPFLKKALADKKRVALPITKGNGVMTAHELYTLSELQPGKYGIPEPPASHPVLDPGLFDLMIVPGLCFDHQGYRLGHGGGYYDRYLKGCACYKIGLCFESRLAEHLPSEDFDQQVDQIITEKRALFTDRS